LAKPGPRDRAPHENPAGVTAFEEGIVIDRVDDGEQAWRDVPACAAAQTPCPA
jgi:hypothetical protein